MIQYDPFLCAGWPGELPVLGPCQHLINFILHGGVLEGSLQVGSHDFHSWYLFDKQLSDTSGSHMEHTLGLPNAVPLLCVPFSKDRIILGASCSCSPVRLDQHIRILP